MYEIEFTVSALNDLKALRKFDHRPEVSALHSRACAWHRLGAAPLCAGER
jgi:hypothetical protein